MASSLTSLAISFLRKSYGDWKLRPGRTVWLDVVRGIAIWVMVAYHFFYAWQLFGPDFWQPFWLHQIWWRVLGWLIGSTFLWLVGVATWFQWQHWLGSSNQRPWWQLVWQRWWPVAVGAGLVTAGTAAAAPSQLVTFGILHAIAAAILISALLVRYSSKVQLATALAIFGLTWLISQTIGFGIVCSIGCTAPPAFVSWLHQAVGFHAPDLQTADYYPLLPWGGVVVLGQAWASARLRSAGSPVQKAPEFLNKQKKRLQFVIWSGQHSLKIYLIHQPIFWLLFQLS